MASSFNVYGGKSEKIGGSIPVWLGTVSPRAKGGYFAAKYCKKGAFYRAGYPINISLDTDKQPVIKPFVAFLVQSLNTTSHTINVYADESGFLPSANDLMSIVGATFGTTSAAAKVSAVSYTGVDNIYAITMATSALDGVNIGQYIALSAATSAASSGEVVADPANAYLYNDVYFDDLEGGATGAAVDFHGEGILIDRTPAAGIAAPMAVAVPNVIQIKG